jgi:LysR family glycine cleavage system transcriptional activator
VRSLVRRVAQLQRLAAFEAVGRLGSFRAAAAELGMSQPAVSKQMKALEVSVKTALFVRSANRSELTREGALLHQTVSETFDLLEARLSRLRGQPDQLRVAVQPSVAESWFVPRLGDLRSAVAPTDVQLIIFDHERELADIDHDVNVRFAEGPQPGMCGERLVAEAVVPSPLRTWPVDWVSHRIRPPTPCSPRPCCMSTRRVGAGRTGQHGSPETV